jgi:hypothetical protein
MGFFPLATASTPALGPKQSLVHWVSGALTPERKWLGREAEHLPPPSAEVKIAWSYTSIPPIRLHSVVLN